MKEIDAVYPYRDSSNWEGNELKYSIRSLAEHFGPLRHIWIVGDKPDWLQGVRFLPFADPYRANKDANIINKVLGACLEDELSQEFVLMNDDIYLLADLAKDRLQPYQVQELSAIETWKDNRFGRRLRNTYLSLSKQGKTTTNFEGHVPYLLDKTRFPRIVLQYAYGQAPGMTINTLYFNNALARGEERPSVRPVRAGFFSPMDYANIAPRTEGKLFLSHDGNGLNEDLKRFIRERFPTPSIYETSP